MHGQTQLCAILIPEASLIRWWAQSSKLPSESHFADRFDSDTFPPYCACTTCLTSCGQDRILRPLPPRSVAARERFSSLITQASAPCLFFAQPSAPCVTLSTPIGNRPLVPRGVFAETSLLRPSSNPAERSYCNSAGHSSKKDVQFLKTFFRICVILECKPKPPCERRSRFLRS